MPALPTSIKQACWRWAETPDNINTDLAISAHFSRELDALLREGIQNAGDGKKTGAQGPVCVTVTLRKVSIDTLLAYCGQKLKTRLESIDGEGRPEEIRGAALRALGNKDVYVLVMEDFNTTGLLGATDSMVVAPNENFTLFMRSSGSGPSKGANKLGSWGLGKATLWFASAVRGIFAYSVRSEGTGPKAVLMGRCLLPTAEIAGKNTRRYKEEGYWGVSHPNDPEFTMPLTDSAAHQQFVKDFGLKRTPEEPGLSVVIPFFNWDAKKNFCDEAARICAEEWALAVACGHISITIADETAGKPGNSGVTLDTSTIQGYRSKFNEPSLTRVFELVALHAASKFCTLAYDEAYGLGRDGAKAFVDAHADTIRASMPATGAALFKVEGVPVNLPSAPDGQKYGHVYLMVTRSDDPEKKHTIQLYRNFLRIGGPGGASSEGSQWPGGNKKSLGVDLWADDDEVAAMIRDGELPSHTGVAPTKSQNFKTAARNDAAWKFIVNLPMSFEAALAAGNNEKDFTVFADIFPAGSDEPASGALKIDTDRLPGAVQGKAYKARIRGSGGAKPYSWSLTSTPTNNLHLDPKTGVLTGQLTTDATLTVTLSDAAGTSVTKNFSITCKAPPLGEPSDFKIDDSTPDAVRVIVDGVPSTWTNGCVVTFGYVQDGKGDSSGAAPVSRALLATNHLTVVDATGNPVSWSAINGDGAITLPWSAQHIPASLDFRVLNAGFRDDRQLVAKVEGAQRHAYTRN